MKAHGVPALMAHLRGEITLQEAAEFGRADTRHYAKRQFTRVPGMATAGICLGEAGSGEGMAGRGPFRRSR